MVRYRFEFPEKTYAIETIARGTGVKVRRYLEQAYGRGRWRKMKGKAVIR